MQSAFSAGPLHSSLPAIAAGEPVAGIVLGIVVFGDRIQISPGMLAIEAGGIAALIVGVVSRHARRPSAGCARYPTSSRRALRPPKPRRPRPGPDSPSSRRDELNGLRQDPELDGVGGLDQAG